MHNIIIGTKHEEPILVTSEVAISFLGLEDARVLATPQMIRYMEWTSRNLVLPMLDKGHDTVGTHVNVSHVAAAPIGSVVTFTSEIIAASDRRVGGFFASRSAGSCAAATVRIVKMVCAPCAAQPAGAACLGRIIVYRGGA